MLFHIPESVMAVLGDTAVETAVDALLSPKLTKLENATWAEIPSHFHAYLAAQQVRVEFAETLLSLWQHLWADLIPQGWTPLTPDQQSKEGWGADLELLYKEEMFGRLFRSAASTAQLYYLAVSLKREEGVQVAFSADDEDGDSIIQSSEGFFYDDDDGLLYSTQGQICARSELDLSPLKLAARHAMQQMQSLR